MERFDFQVQDDSGMWKTMNNSFSNNSQIVLKEMQSLKQRFPNNRVRTVDSSGHLIDILM